MPSLSCVSSLSEWYSKGGEGGRGRFRGDKLEGDIVLLVVLGLSSVITDCATEMIGGWSGCVS